MQSRKTKLTIFLSITLLIGLACSVTAPANPAEPPFTPPPSTEANTAIPAIEIPAAVPTQVPPTEPPPPAPVIGPESAFSWLKLSIPASIAAGAVSTVVPGVSANSNNPPWEVAPLPEEINFTGYALSGTFHQPRINIYPANEFSLMDPYVAEKVTNLQDILKSKPSDLKSVPFLPPWNAAQVFVALPAYLDFQNGSGIRFITQYGQAVMPINNHEMFYSFQGLTTDGKYWISAVLPINHPSIQATYDNPLPADYEQFIADYEAYTQMISAGLAAQPPESFTPMLNALDDMMRSMFVGPLGP